MQMCATVCGGARAKGWGGPLKPINPVSPEGPERQPWALGHSPRAQGGTVADIGLNENPSVGSHPRGSHETVTRIF